MTHDEVVRAIERLARESRWKRIEVGLRNGHLWGYCVDEQGNTYNWIDDKLVLMEWRE